MKIKSGLSMIEVIISMGIITIVISMILPAFFKFNSIFNIRIAKDRSFIYSEEAVFYIKNEITKDTLSCTVENDKILIKKLDGKEKNIYAINNSLGLMNIVVIHIEGDNSVKNNIVKNVKDFRPIIKNNLLYIKITTKEGEDIYRCMERKK